MNSNMTVHRKVNFFSIVAEVMKTADSKEKKKINSFLLESYKYPESVIFKLSQCIGRERVVNAIVSTGLLSSAEERAKKLKEAEEDEKKKEEAVEMLEAVIQASGIESDPPKEFVCPITQSLMKVPVVASDGNTYEWSALKTLFETSFGKARSPLTRDFLNPLSFKNHNLASLIQKWEEDETKRAKKEGKRFSMRNLSSSSSDRKRKREIL